MFSRPGIERALLSIMLRDNKILYEATGDNIGVKHFSVNGNKVIFTAMVHLVLNEGIEKLDSVLIYNTVQDEKAKGFLDELGGLEYIDTLFNACIFNNFEIYSKQLKETYKSRALYDEISKAKLSLENNKEIDGVMEEFEHNTSAIVLDDTKDTSYKVGSNLKERMDERKANPKDVYGYKIGWEHFDKVSQGMQNNDLVVIVGEPKSGKSAILTNWCERLCSSGLKGAYFDTELDDDEFEDRLLSLVSGVEFAEIRNGQCYKDTSLGTAIQKTQMINSAMDEIEQFELYHEFCPDFSIEKVTKMARYYKKEKGIDFLVFDYIKMPNGDVSANSKEYERLGYFTTCLKDLAGTLKIPVITACQTNRTQLGNTDPDAGSIGGSFKILQLASKLYFIRNKTEYELTNEQYKYGNQMLHIAFQRHGGNGEKVHIQFDKPIMRMREVM